jgi:hypothetical protein
MREEMWNLQTRYAGTDNLAGRGEREDMRRGVKEAATESW